MNRKSDLLWGAAAIAAVINRTVAATNHMLRKGQLPAKKRCGRYVASEATLLRYLTDSEPPPSPDNHGDDAPLR